MQSNSLFRISIKVLVILSLIISFMPFQSKTNAAGKMVSGSITENTVWTKQESPYTLTGILTIYPNVTLTIEPGVEVIAGNGKSIDVKGKLKAIGTAVEPIILKDAYINGYDFVNQSIQLEYTNLYHESFNGGYLITSFRRDVTLRHNRFSNGLVSIADPYYDNFVENNFFTRGSTLNVSNGRGKVFIRDNTFLNEGIDSEDILIRSREPNGGLSNVEINRNNFFGQNKINVSLDGYNRVIFNGLDNYWGTTDLLKINRKILDVNDNINFRDRLNIETIAYKPFNNGYDFGTLEPPFVLSVDDNDTTIKGLTDADSTVSVYKGSQMLGQSKSSANGAFSVGISPQPSGSELRISVEDTYGRKSKDGAVTVLDLTPPMTPQVNEISEQTTKVTGKAEPGSSVFVKKDAEVIGNGITTMDGNFEISIEKQVAGNVLNIYSTDSSNNTSTAVTITVKDKTPPIKPVLTTTDVTDQTTVIKGIGEIGSTVQLKVENDLIGIGDVNGNGLFSITFPIQKPGTLLNIMARDTAGNLSEAVTTTVRDVTPPTIKYIGTVTEQSKGINGLAEPGSIIQVKYSGNIISSTVTASDGTFFATIDPQVDGTVLEVTAQDHAGNKSIVFTVIVGISSSFTDLNSNHRFYNEISYLLTKEVITGFPDGSFRPNDKVTRAQAAIMIGRALNLDGNQRETGFKDVGASSKASGFIASAVERGIIKGFPDNTYRPNEPVTRGQMAIFIARAFDLKNEAEVSFTDVQEGSASYIYIKRILAERITTGYSDGTFKPERNLIRSDFSAFMARALEDSFKVNVQ